MGVTNLFKEVKPLVDKATIKKLVKRHGVRKIALDISCQVHQYLKGGNQQLNFDKRGSPVNHICGILSLVNSLHQSGITKIIAVFDNPIPNKWKSGETDKRRTTRKRIKKKIDDMDDDDESKCRRQKQNIQITDDIINGAKFALHMIGIDFCVTPYGFESEHLCAQMQRTGIVDAVITNDSDACAMFGATIIRKNLGTNYYSMYTVQHILNQCNITNDELIDCCLHMGCDFVQKGTPGIGFKTYLKLKDELKLTEHQRVVREYIMSEVPSPEVVVSGNYNSYDLREWLIKQCRIPELKVKKYITNSQQPPTTQSFMKETTNSKTWLIENMPLVSNNDSDDEPDISDVSELSDISVA